MPANPNNQNASLLGYESIASSRTSHNEKLSLAELRFKTGQIIRFTDAAGKIFHVVKTSPGQYVDLKTRKVTSINNIANSLATNATAISMSEAKNTIGANIAEFMDNFQKNKLVIDFETSISGAEKTMAPADVFNMSVGGIHPTKRNRYVGADYFVTDLFDDMFMGDQEKVREAHARFATMSSNVKAGYFKRFNMYAKGKGLDLGGAKSMDDLILNKDKMTSVMTELSHAKSPVEFDPKALNIGANKEREIRAAFGHSRFAQSFMRQSMQMDPDKPYTLGSFNPEGVDERAAQAVGLIKSGQTPAAYNFIDLRGNEMLRVSHLFPHLTSDMTPTMGPAMNYVAHRMRFANKQKDEFFRMFRHGISSVYRKGTTAEGFHEALKYAIDGKSNNTFQEQTHTAMLDVWDHIDQTNKSDKLLLASQQEAMRSDLRFHSPRTRFLMGFIRYSAATAGVDKSSLRNMPGQGKLKNQYLNRFDSNVNYSKLEQMISTNLESATSIKMERNLLQSATKTLGGSTVSQLLGGAFLLTGVRTAVQKMNERFLETRENNMEGLSHNSIPTVIRRLAMTDFGSGWYGTISGSAKILAQMFRNHITDPKGIGALVKKTLSDVSSIVKKYKKGGTYTEMLRDPDRMLELTDKVFGENGHFETMVSDLRGRGTISESFEQFARKSIVGTRNVLGHYLTNKAPMSSATKQTKVAISRQVAEMFVKDGKLTANGLALGVGMLGAYGIMASRGSYNKNASVGPNPYAQTESERMRNARENRDIAKQRISDLRAMTLDGIAYSTPERQQQRYSKTDFGSGLSQGIKTSLLYAKNLAQGKIKSAYAGFKSSGLSAILPDFQYVDLPTDGHLPIGPSSITRVNISELGTGPQKSFSDRVKAVKHQNLRFKNIESTVQQLESKYANAQNTAEGYLHPNRMDSGRVNVNSSTRKRKPSLLSHNKTNWEVPRPRKSAPGFDNAITRDNQVIEAIKNNPKVTQELREISRQMTDVDTGDIPINKLNMNKSHISARTMSGSISRRGSDPVAYKNVTARPPTDRNYVKNPNMVSKVRHLASERSRIPNAATDILSVKKGIEETQIPNLASKNNMDVADQFVDSYRQAIHPEVRKAQLKDRQLFQSGGRVNLAPSAKNIEPVDVKQFMPNKAELIQESWARPIGNELSEIDSATSMARKTKSVYTQRPTHVATVGISKVPADVNVGPVTPAYVRRPEYAQRIGSSYDPMGLSFKDNAISHEMAFGNRPKRHNRYGAQAIPSIPLMHKNPTFDPGIVTHTPIKPYNVD